MSESHTKNHPIIQLLFGTVCIAFAPILVRVSSLGPTQSGFFRTFFGFLILLSFITLFRRSLMEQCRPFLRRRSFWFMILGPSFIFSLDLYFWHKAVIYAGAGVATLLASTQVFYLALFGRFFLKESMGWRYVMYAVGAFLGIFLLVAMHETDDNLPHYMLGVQFGVLTGVIYASYILSMRMLEKDCPALPVEVKMGLVSFITALFLFLLVHLEGGDFSLSAADFLWMILLALIAQVLGWLTITKSLPKIEVSISGLILLLQPILSILMGVAFLSEKLSWGQTLGVVLTLICIYLGERTRRISKLK